MGFLKNVFTELTFNVDKAVKQHLAELRECGKTVVVRSPKCSGYTFSCDILVEAALLLEALRQQPPMNVFGKEDKAKVKAAYQWLEQADLNNERPSRLPALFEAFLLPSIIQLFEQHGAALYCPSCQSVVDVANKSTEQGASALNWSFYDDILSCKNGHVLVAQHQAMHFHRPLGNGLAMGRRDLC